MLLEAVSVSMTLDMVQEVLSGYLWLPTAGVSSLPQIGVTFTLIANTHILSHAPGSRPTPVPESVDLDEED